MFALLSEHELDDPDRMLDIVNNYECLRTGDRNLPRHHTYRRQMSLKHIINPKPLFFCYYAPSKGLSKP